MTMPARHAAIALFALVMLMPAIARAQDYAAIVAAPDRSDADRQTDVRREPAKMLAFAGVKEGMKVLDMEANAGYSTELLARAVGPTGTVWAQDPAAIIERLPTLLTSPSAVVLEQPQRAGQKPALLYVLDVPGATRGAKVVIQIDRSEPLPRNDAKQRSVKTNSVVTATMIDTQALQDRTRYAVIVGKI